MRVGRIRGIPRHAVAVAIATLLCGLGACTSSSPPPAATHRRATTPTATTPAVVPTAQTVHAGAASTVPRAITARSPLQALPPTQDIAPVGLTRTPSGGGYTQVTIAGATSGHTGTAYVWFPPSYGRPGQEHATYPVIEVFHGYKPAPLAFFTYFHLDEEMATLVAAHRMREAVIVIPDWAPGGLDTECVDGGGANPAMETWLMQDVPDYVARTYRVARDRGSWVGYGASTGGWCALMAATLHPATFGSAVSGGGQGYPEFDPPYIPFQPDSPLGQRYDLTRVLRDEAPPVALWMLTSRTDQYSYPTTRTMIAAAKAPTSVDAVVLASGRHHPMFWLPYIPASLEWVGATAAGFGSAK